MHKRSHNWRTIKVGDIVRAKKHILALNEPGTQFFKGEKVKVVKVTDKLIGLIDRFNDIVFFKKEMSKHNDINFIGDSFE